MSTFIVSIVDHKTETTVHKYAVTQADDHFDVELALGGQFTSGGRYETRVEEIDCFTLDQIEMIRL